MEIKREITTGQLKSMTNDFIKRVETLNSEKKPTNNELIKLTAEAMELSVHLEDLSQQVISKHTDSEVTADVTYIINKKGKNNV